LIFLCVEFNGETLSFLHVGKPAIVGTGTSTMLNFSFDHFEFLYLHMMYMHLKHLIFPAIAIHLLDSSERKGVCIGTSVNLLLEMFLGLGFLTVGQMTSSVAKASSAVKSCMGAMHRLEMIG